MKIYFQHASWMMVIFAMTTPAHAGTARGDIVGSTINVEPQSISIRRKLKTLVYLGENEDTYFECEGDCDYDTDCDVSTQNATRKSRFSPFLLYKKHRKNIRSNSQCVILFILYV